MAINDVSLRGKGLNEAIKLLQASSDEITLKISRVTDQHQSRKDLVVFLYHIHINLELSRSFHHPEDYTPSVDSAMESWDSSNTDHRLSDNSEINKEIIVTDHHHPSHTNGHDSSNLHLPRSESKLGEKIHENFLGIFQVIFFSNIMLIHCPSCRRVQIVRL